MLIRCVYVQFAACAQTDGRPSSKEPGYWHDELHMGKMDLKGAGFYGRILECWPSEYPTSLNLRIQFNAQTEEQLTLEIQQLREVFLGAVKIDTFPRPDRIPAQAIINRSYGDRRLAVA